MAAARHRQLVLVALLALCAFLAGSAFSAVDVDAVVEGRLIDIHTDDFAKGRAGHEYLLETTGATYHLAFGERPPVLPRAATVSVRGRRSGNTITVAAGGVTSTAVATAAPPTTGPKRIAVILVNFADNRAAPYTPAFANSVAFTNANSVAAYYGEVSHGLVSLSGDVLGWYQLPDTSASCNWSQWATDADQAATAAGADIASYDYRVYAFPTVAACSGWAGLSYMPGTQAWLQGSSGMSLHVLAHELGHAFGTHHANSYACTENGVRVSLSSNAANCTSTEYGDPWSVMGGVTSRRQDTSFSRANFGWLTVANTLDVTGNGTYTIDPLGPADPSGVQALRIPRDATTYFLLEFRQPYGASFDNFSSADAAVKGVMVRIVPSYSTLSQSQLVDTTPATSSFEDAPLTVGRSLHDPLSNITITTTAVSSTGASVTVDLGGATLAPAPPTSLAASLTGASTAALSWIASAGAAGYKVYRDGVYLATTGATTYTDGGLAPGRPTPIRSAPRAPAAVKTPPSASRPCRRPHRRPLRTSRHRPPRRAWC